MDIPAFQAELQRMVRRTAELFSVADDTDPLLRTTLAELRSSIEELSVAEEELRERAALFAAANDTTLWERARYRSMFLEAPFGYVVTSTEGIVREVDTAASRMLGSPAEVIVGVPLAAFVAAVDRKRWYEMLANHARDPLDPITVRLRVRTRGETAWLRCRVHLAREHDVSRDLVSYRFALLDASDEERAELAERLDEDARRKDEFLTTLAHELRNVLAPIRAAIDLWRLQRADRGVDRLR